MNELVQYEPESSRDRVLAAAQDARWVPILQSPFDFREEDPRFAEALKPAMEIFGRLAVALHVAYEEACRPGFPLLLHDRSKSKIQYAIKDAKPGFYHLVFFQGEERGKQRFCSLAKVVLVPELAIEDAKKKFLIHRDDYKVYLPEFEGNISGIRGATRSILVAFNKDYHIWLISAAYPREDGQAGTFRSYYFFEGRNFRIKDIQPPHDVNWLYAFDDAEEFSLNRDGVFRSVKREIRDIDLAREILEIASQLPLEHHIRE